MPTRKAASKGIRVDHARRDVIGYWIVFMAGEQEIICGPLAPESKTIRQLTEVGLRIVDNRGR